MLLDLMSAKEYIFKSRTSNGFARANVSEAPIPGHVQTYSAISK